MPNVAAGDGVSRSTWPSPAGDSAVVSIERPGGRAPALFFEAGKAVDAELRQGDGNMSFDANKQAGLCTALPGNGRGGVPEAVINGG